MMLAFGVWVVLLLGLCKMTRGWARAFFVALYVLGSLLAVL